MPASLSLAWQTFILFYFYIRLLIYNKVSSHCKVLLLNPPPPPLTPSYSGPRIWHDSAGFGKTQNLITVLRPGFGCYSSGGICQTLGTPLPVPVGWKATHIFQLKTNQEKFAVIWVEKAKRQGLLRPTSPKITLTKERSGKEATARNGCTLLFLY